MLVEFLPIFVADTTIIFSNKLVASLIQQEINFVVFTYMYWSSLRKKNWILVSKYYKTNSVAINGTWLALTSHIRVHTKHFCTSVWLIFFLILKFFCNLYLSLLVASKIHFKTKFFPVYNFFFFFCILYRLLLFYYKTNVETCY